MNSKKIAADKAVEYIEDGMVVGLGTGSTASWAIEAIAQKMRQGLSIRAVASSESSERLAVKLGIPIVPFSDIDGIDMTIDGADEVDSRLNLIKGGGGALLREKILAANSKTFIVIVDESKPVEHLRRFPLPVEIVPFAMNLTINKLIQLSCKPILREAGGKHYVTDNGNLIVDCQFNTIKEPVQLHEQLSLIPGVVEHGLFIQMAAAVVVGYNDGTTKITGSDYFSR